MFNEFKWMFDKLKWMFDESEWIFNELFFQSSSSFVLMSLS